VQFDQFISVALHGLY